MAQRPVTLHFVPPTGDDSEDRKGPPLPFEFDDSPTGLRLHWNESEERVVRIESIEAGSQADGKVRRNQPVEQPRPPVRRSHSARPNLVAGSSAWI